MRGATKATGRADKAPATGQSDTAKDEEESEDGAKYTAKDEESEDGTTLRNTSSVDTSGQLYWITTGQLYVYMIMRVSIMYISWGRRMFASAHAWPRDCLKGACLRVVPAACS